MDAKRRPMKDIVARIVAVRGSLNNLLLIDVHIRHPFSKWQSGDSLILAIAEFGLSSQRQPKRVVAHGRGELQQAASLDC